MSALPPTSVDPARASVPRASKATSRRRWSAGQLVLRLVLLVVAVVMIAPLVWLIVQSLTEETSAFSTPPNWFPNPATTENFAAVDDLVPFWKMALNSLVVALISTVGSILVSVLAAYGFSRLPFRGRDRVFALMLAALMIPAQMTVIPVFVLMRKLQLIDTLTALWLPALVNVFAIFFFRQYFNTIPRDLDEAARIDGAGHLWILFRMILPLSGPAIAAMAILVFEASWNSYFAPLIFLSSPERMTLPVGLVTLQAGQGGSSVVVFAAITAVVVPALVVFLLFQRAFVASIASAGIRG